ncbi:hypothetical protein CWATWH0402_3606 [Crocosphaera watsonii WH 0402]|uniref:Uncharacterized protein n=1 Tax=Crocosphaera watsonii WH 0402 TaxID=1284629 RepID=T2JXN1_CROWT|nr:hypothetical protein CWATWH0402_3606 [Crocosphaera watsonii WH 0402]
MSSLNNSLTNLSPTLDFPIALGNYSQDGLDRFSHLWLI